MLLSTNASSVFVLRVMCISANMARNPLNRSNDLVAHTYRGHWNRSDRESVVSGDMERTYNWAWVESAVSAAIADWNNCADAQVDRGPLVQSPGTRRKGGGIRQCPACR